MDHKSEIKTSRGLLQCYELLCFIAYYDVLLVTFHLALYFSELNR